MKKNKKQRKSSLLTIGAFVVVGILVVGTIVGIVTGGLFTGDSKDEDSIPLTRQLKNTDAATATAVTAGTEKAEEQTEASPSSEQAAGMQMGNRYRKRKSQRKQTNRKKRRNQRKHRFRQKVIRQKLTVVRVARGKREEIMKFRLVSFSNVEPRK